MTKGQLQAVIVRWLLVPWEMLREPKVWHAMIATGYAGLVVTGIGAAMDGQWITAALFVIGGVLPLLSLHGGHWGLERTGLYLLVAALVHYSGWVVPAQSETLGEVVMRAGAVGFIVAAMCARWWHIRGLDMDPDR